ncbi:hypothetical protein [Spirosoma harenae]
MKKSLGYIGRFSGLAIVLAISLAFTLYFKFQDINTRDPILFERSGTTLLVAKKQSAEKLSPADVPNMEIIHGGFYRVYYKGSIWLPALGFALLVFLFTYLIIRAEDRFKSMRNK